MILFEKKNENYLSSFIFDHPMIFREPRDKNTINPLYLDLGNNHNLVAKFASCELQNFCGPDGVLDHAPGTVSSWLPALFGWICKVI
jgi:hypothetical protein